MDLFLHLSPLLPLSQDETRHSLEPEVADEGTTVSDLNLTTSQHAQLLTPEARAHSTHSLVTQTLIEGLRLDRLHALHSCTHAPCLREA